MLLLLQMVRMHSRMMITSVGSTESSVQLQLAKTEYLQSELLFSLTAGQCKSRQLCPAVNMILSHSVASSESRPCALRTLNPPNSLLSPLSPTCGCHKCVHQVSSSEIAIHTSAGQTLPLRTHFWEISSCFSSGI